MEKDLPQSTRPCADEQAPTLALGRQATPVHARRHQFPGGLGLTVSPAPQGRDQTLVWPSRPGLSQSTRLSPVSSRVSGGDSPRGRYVGLCPNLALFTCGQVCCLF